jgi:hypothetical protein
VTPSRLTVQLSDVCHCLQGETAWTTPLRVIRRSPRMRSYDRSMAAPRAPSATGSTSACRHCGRGRTSSQLRETHPAKSSSSMCALRELNNDATERLNHGAGQPPRADQQESRPPRPWVRRPSDLADLSESDRPRRSHRRTDRSARVGRGRYRSHRSTPGRRPRTSDTETPSPSAARASGRVPKRRSGVE